MLYYFFFKIERTFVLISNKERIMPMNRIKEGDVVWEAGPVLDSEPLKIIGIFAVPVIVDKVLNDSTFLVSHSPQKHIIGKDAFLTRDECILKQSDRITWLEDDKEAVCHFDGLSPIPFGTAIPDDSYMPPFSTYYVGYPYKSTGRVPDPDGDELNTLKDVREKLFALYPDEKKFTVVAWNVGCRTLFTFGFRDDEHWYMHGVASSF